MGFLLSAEEIGLQDYSGVQRVNLGKLLSYAQKAGITIPQPLLYLVMPAENTKGTSPALSSPVEAAKAGTITDMETYTASKIEAWARIGEDKSIIIEGEYPGGEKVTVVFQAKSRKTGQDSKACKLMTILAYHRDKAIQHSQGAHSNKNLSLSDVMKDLAIADLKVLCDLVNGTARKLKAAGFPEDTLDRLYYPTLKKLQNTKGDSLKRALQKPLRLNFGALHCDDTLTRADSRAGTKKAIDKGAYLASLGIDPSLHNEDFDAPEEGDE